MRALTTALSLAALLATGLTGCEVPQSGIAAPPAEDRTTKIPEATNKLPPSAPLTPEERALFTTVLRCGDTRVEFALTDKGMADMRIANTSYAMRTVEAASGAKYENLGHPETSFWNKGNAAIVTIDNETLPECDVLPPDVATPEKAYIARGNEPGWKLSIDNATVTLETDYGELHVIAPVTTDHRSGELRTVAATSGSDYLQVSISHQPCADAMSGDRFEDQVTVTLNDRRFTGCGGAHWLRQVDWRLINLNNRSIVGNARLTLRFDEEARLSGSAGCNRFQGSYSLEGDRLAIDPAITATKMGCQTDALMQQESAYLALLPAMKRATVDPSGALILSDDSDQRLTFRSMDDQ